MIGFIKLKGVVNMKRINNNLPVIAFNIYLSETKQQASSNSFNKFQALPLITRLYYHDKALSNNYC